MKKCTTCGFEGNLTNFYSFKHSPDGHESICKGCRKKYTRKHNSKIRKITQDHYGNKCSCCGESTPEFLAIDHVNNDGAKHRKKLHTHGGIHFYRWLIKNDFPLDFQLLCHNCNIAKQLWGICPHQKK